jgi:hypothetical protein
MGVYKAWLEDDETEEDATEYPDVSPGGRGKWALDAENAAEMYADSRYADCEYPDELTVCVRDPEGVLTKWTVTVEMRPSFTAHEAKETG